MRPIPNINDEAAMILTGKRSAIGRARNEAAEALRDACTFCQSADWDNLAKHAQDARDAADRLATLAAMWAEV